MGVYIYQSCHGPWIKVGHYSGQNAYSRVAHRGFGSCVCPRDIRDRVSIEDVELLAWFPMLTQKDEAAVKKKWKDDRVYGKSEWFPQSRLEEIRAFLIERGGEDRAKECDRQMAMDSRRRL